MTEPNDPRAHLRDAARSLIAAARAALDVAENFVDNPPSPPKSRPSGVRRIRVEPDDDEDGGGGGGGGGG